MLSLLFNHLLEVCILSDWVLPYLLHYIGAFASSNIFYPLGISAFLTVGLLLLQTQSGLPFSA